jgi:hypothetical protein
MGHDDDGNKILLFENGKGAVDDDGDAEKDTSIVPRLNTHSIPQWKEVLSRLSHHDVLGARLALSTTMMMMTTIMNTALNFTTAVTADMMMVAAQVANSTVTTTTSAVALTTVTIAAVATNSSSNATTTACEMCGWLAAIGSMLAFGSFGVPIKSEACQRLQVDPLVFQSYKTAMCFFTSWLILFFGRSLTTTTTKLPFLFFLLVLSYLLFIRLNG